MKIALIPGHTKSAPGASNYKKESEYPWAKRVLTRSIAFMPKIECFIITRDVGGIEGAYREAKKLGCTAVIEMHFNWAETDPVNDIEILADKRLPKSIKLAKFLAKKENEAYTSFGLRRDEGCFATTPSDRGGNNVAQGVVQGIEYAILWEPQFGNLKNSDAMQLFDNEDKFSKLIGESLTEFFTLEGLIQGSATTTPATPSIPVVDNTEVLTALKKVSDMIINPMTYIKQGTLQPIDNWKPIVQMMDGVVAQSMAGLVKTKPVTPPVASTPVSATMDGLVKAYKNYKIEFESLKGVTLGQFTLESGRVTTDLAKLHFNFGGVKFRSDVPNCPKGATILKDYVASDGPNDYFQCDSYETFFELYWKFLERAPYKGWRQFANDPEGFIKFIAKAGYCPRALYAEDVIKLIPEAKERLAKA